MQAIQQDRLHPEAHAGYTAGQIINCILKPMHAIQQDRLHPEAHARYTAEQVAS